MDGKHLIQLKKIKQPNKIKSFKLRPMIMEKENRKIYATMLLQLNPNVFRIFPNCLSHSKYTYLLVYK